MPITKVKVNGQWEIASPQAGGGTVSSVNGQTGTVVLDADDVGALPDNTSIPSNTSDLNNDSGFITSSDIPVTSVNSKTGAVSLSASDVGALPSSTTIPTKVSELQNDSGFTTNTGTVTSVRVQATSPVSSSTSTAQSTSLDTTISLASAYGDTQNPYGSKTANYVLAAPNGSSGNPSFRALVSADIPDLSGTYAPKATTIAGYGITDAKISNGTITLGSDTITPLTSFTESDPVFTASAAYGISSSDITNWNGKTSNTGDMEKSTYDTNNSGVVDKATVLDQTLETKTKDSSSISSTWGGLTSSITGLSTTGVYMASLTLTYTASANTVHYPMIGIGATASLADQQVKDQKYCASTGARQFSVSGIITGVTSIAPCATTGTSSVTATATDIELRVIRIA